MPSIAFWMFAAMVILVPSASAQIVKRFVSTDGKTHITYINSAKLGEEDIYVVNLKKTKATSFASNGTAKKWWKQAKDFQVLRSFILTEQQSILMHRTAIFSPQSRAITKLSFRRRLR